ncbi:MAG TPA: ice-binding family protein [Clostridium sp.]
MKKEQLKKLLSSFLIIIMVLFSFSSAFAASVNLGTAGNYAILAKSGISSVPNSVITGNIGVSPIASTAITGFSLTADATNEFSVSNQIIGKAYAADYASPTPSNLTTAISNMETAYTDAAGRAANYTELYTGDISGQTLTAGVYKWGTGVLINSDVTLNGGPNDVWIFQIAKGITQATGTKIILTGGAQAKNIFWQSSETVSIGADAHFEGIILGKTDITMGTNASINGRLLAQTAVTLIKNTVVAPSVESVKTVEGFSYYFVTGESYASNIQFAGYNSRDKKVYTNLTAETTKTVAAGKVATFDYEINVFDGTSKLLGNLGSYGTPQTIEVAAGSQTVKENNQVVTLSSPLTAQFREVVTIDSVTITP